MESMRGWPAVGALVVLALICVVLAILYGVGALQVLTSTGTGIHKTHAILFAGLAVVCLVGASFMRPRAAGL